MAGHSKWKQIKDKKAVEDAKRSKLFSMMAKQISVAVKAAGGERNSATVKAAIEKARKANMPSENIERAIARASGAGAESLEQVNYEFYGPGGVGVIVSAITNNKNRTHNEIKHLLSEAGFSLAAPGAVAWAFEQKRSEDSSVVWQPKTTVPLSEEDKQKLSELIEKLEEHEDVDRVFTNAT